MHPEYDLIIEYLRSNPVIEPMIYTNGLLLREHITALGDIPINVSIHKQGYQVTLDNIKEYIEKTGKNPTMHIVRGEFSDDETPKIIRETWKLGEVQYHPMISEDLKVTPRYPVPCQNPFYYLGILWNGETVPCCHMLSPGDFSMGNVFSHCLNAVWEGNPYESIRAGRLEGTPCATCQIYRGMKSLR